MWRKTSFAANQDSDQSISEEEDLAPEWPEKCIALGGNAETKGGIQIQSQLEVLRDTQELDHRTETAIFVNKSRTGCSSEDEVEIPVSHDEGDFISSPTMASTYNLDEEIIYDDEENNVHSTLSIPSGAQNLQKIGLCSPGSEKQDGACIWSAVTKETEAFVHLTENARSSSLHAVTSNVNKSRKGGRGKAKTKCLFRLRSHKEDIPWPVSSNDEVIMSSKVLPLPQELEAVASRTMEKSMADLVENFQGGKVEKSEIYGLPAEVAIGHDCTEHSMAELLDSYQEKTGLPWGNSKMNIRMKGRRVQPINERNMSPAGARNMDNDDPPEALDSESSSDDEVSPRANVQNLGLIIPESKAKTMTDKFQEALGAASIHNEGPPFALHGIGIFGKFQQVMQSEKKRDSDFLKRLQTGFSSKDDANFIDVEILSSCLEAKLTVCCCSLDRDKEV